VLERSSLRIGNKTPGYNIICINKADLKEVEGMSEITSSNVLGGLFGANSSLLFFFLLLVIIFCNCGLFKAYGDSLLFFFLLLVILFSGPTLFGRC